ncbi:thioredoxin fold domain-containing protein [Thiohalocapsa marina]|uniref:Thioredoxin fold domain-containing protein n=1 Tax=Thiohalocapsa marina TaxID=424902 RepID=A0A5M8FT40_9GAMM|nr:thioredoxin fold domain-containing protein [Thiohalocapsa marina]KAA6186952.1 thioredoxin fold domain-containing protein [Thiohalocapsa marina]
MAVNHLPAQRLLLPGLLLASACLFNTAGAQDAANATAPGAVTGGKQTAHPAWFKESFLDIAEDVSEAADDDKHVILFLEMNGCPYCYKMIEENFKSGPDSDFIQSRFDVIALNVRGDREVALDADTALTEKALADQLDVRFTPTLVFLDQHNTPVARISGYRKVAEMKQVLDYVDSKAYQQQSLGDYLQEQRREHRRQLGYAFREHPQVSSAADVNDLSRIDGPLALLFEDNACSACDDLHAGHLARADVQQALAPFTTVRIDTLSDAALIGPDGGETTQRQLAADLGVDYRPTLVLMDGPAGDKQEIARIESMLYRYHFIGLLEYVGGGHYRDYPDSPFDYIDAKTAALISAGKDVAIADE